MVFPDDSTGADAFAQAGYLFRLPFTKRTINTDRLSKAIFAVAMIAFFPVMIILAAAKKA